MLRVFINIFFISLFCLIPVFLVNKSLKRTAAVGFCMFLFLFLWRNFFLGYLSAFHDTYWGGKIIFEIMSQWARSGFSYGWNPYMNAGEPIYLFSNNFFKAPNTFFAIINKFMNLNPHALFNQYWIFLFFNFCAGAYVLFHTLFDDFKITLFCFLSLLLSTCFYINTGQPAGLTVFYFIPFVFFGIVTFLKLKSPYGLFFTGIYAAFSLNQYIPIYALLVCFFFCFFILMLRPSYMKESGALIRRQYKLAVLTAVLALLAAGPALFLNSEIKNFTSPSRGALQPSGAVTAGRTGAQPRVSAGFSDYKIFIDRALSKDKRGGIHHAFYFGILPLLFVPLGLFGSKDRFGWAFFCTACAAILAGSGQPFILEFLYKFIPKFNMARHTFVFAQFVPICLICAAGFGLKYMLSEGFNIKIFFILAAGCVLLFFLTEDKISRVIILSSFAVLFLASALLSVMKKSVFSRKLAYLFIFFMLMADLSFSNIKALREYRVYPAGIAFSVDIGQPSDFVYPDTRSFYPARMPLLPYNLFPLYFKEASVTSPSEDYIFLRSSRLHDMLAIFRQAGGSEPALGVGAPIVFLTDDAKVFDPDAPKDAVIREVLKNFIDPKSGRMRVFFQKNEIDFDIAGVPGGDLSGFSWAVKKRDNPDNIDISVDVPRDAFLVRLENFHKGWRAFIDGTPARIYRANYAFSAIRVPKGRHDISFKFITIYPILFDAYIFCACLTWIVFNFYLNRFPKSGLDI